MNIINCTRHDIRVQDVLGNLIHFPPHGEFAPRVQEEYTTVSQINTPPPTLNKATSFAPHGEVWAKINVREHYFNETVGLPPQKDETMYIVSKMVAEANPLRRDLLFVSKSYNMSNGLRACEAFAQWPLPKLECDLCDDTDRVGFVDDACSFKVCNRCDTDGADFKPKDWPQDVLDEINIDRDTGELHVTRSTVDGGEYILDSGEYGGDE